MKRSNQRAWVSATAASCCDPPPHHASHARGSDLTAHGVLGSQAISAGVQRCTTASSNWCVTAARFVARRACAGLVATAWMCGMIRRCLLGLQSRLTRTPAHQVCVVFPPSLRSCLRHPSFGGLHFHRQCLCTQGFAFWFALLESTRCMTSHAQVL